MVEGRRGIEDTREVLYAKTRTLMDNFSKKYGASNCPDLIHIQLGTPEASAAYQERGLKSQCEGYIREVTRKTIELLESPD